LKREISKKKLQDHDVSIHQESVYSLGSTPTHRNREQLAGAGEVENHSKASSKGSNLSAQNPKLLHFVQMNNQYEDEDLGSALFSPKVDEESD